MMARRWSTALLLEVLLGVPGGQVLFVSVPDVGGVAATEEEEVETWSVGHVCFANGLAWNPREGVLYVVSSTHGVYMYGVRDVAEPGVTHAVGFVRTPFAGDGVVYSSATGRVFVSGVSSVSKFATAMMSAEAPKGPSWTVELLGEVKRRGEGEEGEVKREKAFRAVDLANRPLREEERRWRSVFMDDGGFFGGVSNGGVVDEKGTFVAVSSVGEGVVTCGKVLERRGSVVGKGEEEFKGEL